MIKFLTILLLLPSLAFADYGRNYINSVVNVYDDDTFRPNISQWPANIGQNIGIRINRVESPEILGKCEFEQKLAKEARKITFDSLSNAEVSSLETYAM